MAQQQGLPDLVTTGLQPATILILQAANPTLQSISQLDKLEMQLVLRVNLVDPVRQCWGKPRLAQMILDLLGEVNAQQPPAIAQQAQPQQAQPQQAQPQQAQPQQPLPQQPPANAQQQPLVDAQQPEPAQQQQTPQEKPLRCMTCGLRPVTHFFSKCFHVGICEGCREDILDRDVWHAGDAREGLCQVVACRKRHTATEIAAIFLVYVDKE
ncbi:uncharacterized protein LOC132192835 [Neocloeon triangulifer]|uniref:uncharacterized protein LOC132192835 n=1 Tax=Neocloeon triangulifer TaxID=2078957 RepID=UPI00286F4C78|nr:uncharacterized protein LOC132192835 [Neocloeon triangulifer]